MRGAIRAGRRSLSARAAPRDAVQRQRLRQRSSIMRRAVSNLSLSARDSSASCPIGTIDRHCDSMIVQMLAA
ncbi:hypothetical protein [Sphingobium cupriresistens]|uniref:hypothetical protein n=1 Tax=Sphingobium cupriresistens TaxID=1132417 RepID=UPI003BF50160